MSLETHLEELEKLVAEMESDTVSLDDAFLKYEHAFKLAKTAWDDLKKHQTTFSVLTKKADKLIQTKVDLDT